MSWSLEIWPANRSGPPAIIRNTDLETGIDDGFEWQLTPWGGTVQLRIQAMNARTRFPPLGLVQLSVNGEPQFYGQVPDPSHSGQQDVEEQLVLGGREVLKRALMDGKVYRDAGVYTIARDVLARLCPPGVSYNPALIGNGSGTDAGPTLSTYYAPTKNLDDVLSDLATSAGTVYDVDVRGGVFLGRPAPAPRSVAYSGQGWERLRVQGRETVTRAVLRVVTAPAGLENGAVSFSGAGVPATVTAVAESPLHGVYRAERAVEPPEGVALLVPQQPFGWVPRAGNLDAGPAMDGSSATYTAVPLGTTQQLVELESRPGRPVGVEVDYTLLPNEKMPQDAYGLTLEVATARASLPLASGAEMRTLRLILPPDASTSGTWGARVVVGATMAVSGVSGIELRVHEVRFLIIDEARAAQVAASFLQVPFTLPAQISLPGLVAPTPDLTVTASPDGDVTGPTGLWEYLYTLNDYGTTLARLGSDGQSDQGRAIKFAVREAR